MRLRQRPHRLHDGRERALVGQHTATTAAAITLEGLMKRPKKPVPEINAEPDETDHWPFELTASEPGLSVARHTLVEALTGRLPFHLGDLSESELSDLRQEAAALVSHLDTLLEFRRRLTHEHRKPEPDHLLSPEDAAKRFNVKRRWLLDHADEIPGSRRLSRKLIRFSERGLSRYLNGRKS
jgi:hypothetical protein